MKIYWGYWIMYQLDQIVITSLHHKTHVAELWHGKQADTAWTEIPRQELVQALVKVRQLAAQQELHKEEQPLNFVMPAAGLLWPAAALEAKQKGVALNLAICVGAPDDPWAQFLRTGVLPQPQTQRQCSDAALVLEAIGAADAAQAAARGEAVQLTAEQLDALREQVGVDLVTDARAENFLRKIYEMTEYVQHPETARTYNGLQDYRVMWAESTPSILLALEDPRSEAGQVCRVLALEDDAALEHAMTTGRRRYAEY